MKAKPNRRSGGGILIGVGAGFAIVVLLVVQAASSGGLFGTRTETLTVTTTVTPNQQALGMVNDSFSQHMLLLESGKASAVIPQYETNANVTWIRNECFAGLYVGTGNITVLLNTFLVDVAPGLVIGNVTRTLAAEANGSVLVNSTFGFAGQGSGRYGLVNGTVSAQDLYAYSTTNGSWLISQETWDFLAFNMQFLCFYG